MDKIIDELYNKNNKKDELRLCGIFCATSVNEMSYMIGDNIFMETRQICLIYKK